MAVSFTFDEVKRRADQNNITMSDADWRLAQQNPQAGMTLVNYKIDYGKAATPQQRALINQQAEQLRRTEGGYTAGYDGKQYYAEPKTSLSAVTSFTPASAKTSAQSMAETYGSSGSFGSGSSPGYHPYSPADNTAGNTNHSANAKMNTGNGAEIPAYAQVQTAAESFTPYEYQAPERPVENNPYESAYQQALARSSPMTWTRTPPGRPTASSIPGRAGGPRRTPWGSTPP